MAGGPLDEVVVAAVELVAEVAEHVEALGAVVLAVGRDVEQGVLARDADGGGTAGGVEDEVDRGVEGAVGGGRGGQGLLIFKRSLDKTPTLLPSWIFVFN